MKVAGHYILDARGEPVPCDDLLTWARWFETANSHLDETQVGDARISTIFLGLDHHHHWGERGRPILWETLVFGGPLDGEMARYPSRRQAQRGHDRMVARVREATGTVSVEE